MSSDNLTLYTDASGAVGFAAILKEKWFAHWWPAHLQSRQIATKELIPIVLALETWADILTNKKILFKDCGPYHK